MEQNAAMNPTPELESLTSLGALDQRLQRREQQREIHWYDVPETIASTTGVSRIGLVELTSDEYLMAANRCQNNLGRLSLELVKESVRKIDGRSINTGDGSADMFWNTIRRGMSKLQSLANTAYGRIHNASNDETESFLLSENISTG